MSQNPPPKDRDVAFLYARTGDGEGFRMLRARQGRIEAGEVRPLREGRPLHGGEVVKLKPHDKVPNLYDVEVSCELPPRRESSGRPAQVATDAYRRNWERIFNSSKNESSLN